MLNVATSSLCLTTPIQRTTRGDIGVLATVTGTAVLMNDVMIVIVEANCKQRCSNVVVVL